MIAFLTLLLGLTTGAIPIQVTVDGPVAAVEYVLDGAAVARAEAPPWSATIDFGKLEPHEFVARALDRDGKEIARASQWLNVPRPPAEVEILLEPGPEGNPAAARLSWQSLIATHPATISLTLDDRPLVVQDRRAILPAVDLKVAHILTAELRFSPGVVARKDVVFGGEWGSQVSTELTAVPVRVARGIELPAAERLEGWFTGGGRPLPVGAVDDGPGRVVVVRVAAATEILHELVPPAQRRDFRSLENWRNEMRLGEEDTVRIFSADASVHRGSGIPTELFEGSRELTAADGGLFWLLTRHTLHSAPDADRGRIADAVAVAGLHAATGNYRRAVVLVLSADAKDNSRYEAAAVRRYLDSIHVPLFVWSLESPKKNPGLAVWGDVEVISSIPRISRAIADLRTELASQRIVWLEGRHLPQSIALTPEAKGIEMLTKR
ncbi:MAG TPA: hypothetical protein VL025_04680 [Thermoanaerobaculia bacterium]|nr:hypothetical protein [Thermoanaerobaculia bacterium]